MSDKRRILYDALSQTYNLGTYEDFNTKIEDESKRRALYDAASKKYNLGDYDSFSSKLGTIKETAEAQDPFAPEDNFKQPMFGSMSYQENIGKLADSLYYPSPLNEEGRAEAEPITSEERSKQEYEMLMRQLNDFDAQNGSFMDTYEAYEEVAKHQVNEDGFAFDTREREYLNANSNDYHLRKQERDALNDRIKNNSYFNQMRMAEADAANETVDAISNLMAQNEAENPNMKHRLRAKAAMAMNPRGSIGLSALKDDKELKEYGDTMADLATAKRLYENTAKVYAAPINDGEDILKKFGQGFGQRLGEADFWTIGAIGIADDINARAAFQKIQDKFGSVKEFANLTDAEIDALLTPSEQLLISAVMDNNAAMYARKDNTAGAYEAGSGAADSLMFMAQFLLTGGIGDAATVGTAAHRRLVSWLGRKVGSISNGLMRDVARGAVKLGVGTAESIGKALVMTPLMPHTYANIADKMMSFDDNGELMDTTDAIISGSIDALIETWSEGTGDFVNKILGVPGKITKGVAKKALKNVDFSDWGKVMNAPMMQILKKGGFNGFLGEIGEEFIGNATRSFVGTLAPGSGQDPEALKNFAQWEQLLVTAGSFAPMTILGLGVSSAQFGLAKRKLAKAQSAFEAMLRGASYTEDQTKFIIDELLGSTDAHLTPERLIQNFSPLLRELAFNDKFANNRTEALQSAVDFMWQIARYRAFDGVYHRQEEQQRNDMLAEIQEGTGREFWTTKLSENAGLDGTAYETDEVRAVEFNDGKVAYVLGSDGTTNTVVYNDGQTGFLSEEQLNEGKVNGSIVSDATMGLNDYLTQQVARVRMTEEEQRMFAEKNTNIGAIRAQFPIDATVELGTTEAPIQGVVRQQTPDGVIVESPAGISQLTWEELGHTIGLEVNPQTDSQMEEEAINNLEIADLQRRRAREQRRTQRNTAAEAALAEEQMLDEAENEGLEKPIPMKADGTVDQTAFWNESPARWAQWKTEQRQDGGAYASSYIQNAIGILEGQIAESEAAFLAESDFDAKDTLEQTINQQRARLAELQDLSMQYMPSVIPAETSVEATAEQTQPNEEASQPAAVMAERQKFELDAEYQRRLSLAKTLAEKEMILKEYFEAISAGSMEAVVMNKQNYKQIMKDNGCDENAIERVTRSIKIAEEVGQAVSALHANDKIFVIADYNYTVEQGRVSYVHERQHNITKNNPELIQRVLSLGLSRETLQKIVRTLSGTTFYDNESDEVLADEILSSTMEIAYTFDDFSVTLSKLGLPIELINVLNEINDEQRNDFTLANARRNAIQYDNPQGNSGQNVRDQGEVSGGILGEEGDGSLGDSNRRTESGETTTGGAEASEEGLQVPLAEVDKESEEVNPAFVEAISTDVDEAEYAQFLDDKAFADPQPVDGIQPDDVRFSVVLEDKMRGNTQAYFDKHYNGGTLGKKDQKLVPLNVTHFTQVLLDAANAQIEEMRKYMLPYLDMESKGKRFLPAEVYGKSTLFDNSSYGKTMENTLICTRTLAYIDFVEEVKKRIGRPLTATESFLASQMLYDIAVDPQCLYCYVSLDRKAYDEFLLRYIQQRDEVISKWNASDKSAEAKDALYKEFLAGRKPTSQMQARFESWLLLSEGDNAITPADLATKARRGDLKISEAPEAWEKARNKYQKLKGDKKLAYAASEEYQTALWNYLASPLGQVTDAEAYAQSASWAKKEEDYRSYTGELLKCTADALKGLMGHYGLRFYSFSEYSPAFILENMQMVRDAAARGLKGFAYTKEIDFIKIFAPTGMNINCSVYGRVDSEGNVVPDIKQGADWAQVQALREQYPNVGAVFVATNDEMVEWALNQPWIDVIIPFHIVRTGADIAKFYEWTNYSSMQADTAPSGKTTYIFPHEHHNDKTTFLKIAQERGLSPRFADVKLADGRSIVEHPNYMRLVNETRRSVDETPILTPTFNVDAAKESFDAFVAKGGYYSGYFYEDEAFEQGIETVVEDIKAGKTAKDVDYGRQDVPIDVAKIMAKRAEMERKHGKSGAIDLVEEAKKADLRHRITAERTLVPGHKKGQPMLSDAEMMADVSFRITKNTKSTIETWFNKAGVNEEFTQSVIHYLDSTFEDATEQLCAAKWYLGGKINLPGEDDYKVRDAVKVAKKNKVDALLYDSPMDLIYQFGKPNEKQKPINPDNVPTLKNRTEVPGTDIVIYDVEESEESRENMREIINTHYGKNASPWCLLQGNEFGQLTPEAKERWEYYSAYPKQVAFKGGRLLAFSANSEKKVAWWDRLDKPYEGVPIMEKLNDAQNRRATSVINPKTGKQIRIADVHSRTEKDGYTIIRNWDSVDGPMINAQRRKGDALIAQFNRYTKEDFATDLQYWFAGRPNRLDQVYTQDKTINFSPNGALETYNVEGYRLAYNRYGRATWLITTKTPVIQEYGFNRKGKLVSFFSGTELIYDRKRLSEVEVPEEFKALVGRSPKSFMAEAEQLIIEAGLAEAYEESKSDVRFRITPEMESIREKAKKDGTFMKAPNGQPTNLTEEQWLMVRTQNFIKWFGDWIAAYRAEKIKNLQPEPLVPMPKDKTSLEVYESLRNGVNKHDGIEVKFFKSAYKKVIKVGQISEQIIASLPNIFDSSVLAYSENDNLGGLTRPDGTKHKEHRNVDEVRHYVGKVEVDGKVYYVRFTVNVQKNNTGLHSYFTTDIDLYENITATSASRSELLGARLANGGIVDAKLESFFEKANNSSKVVDENGEPKVVYHQTNQKIYVNRETGENWDELGWKEKMEWDERDDWEDYWEEQDFNTFSRVNARTTNEFDGFFFAPEYDENHEYGDRTIAAFVNIKNPASREDYNIDSRYNDAGRNERIRLQEAGFDGVIRMDGDNVDEYIAFEPNQIKSATDNNGDFNPNNNDIRFRITPEQDKAYMDAVKAGDMETAQRMVVEAAKLAMPNTKVVDENGNPKVVYHGTGSEFYTFRKTNDSNELGAGYYFSDSYEMAERYATDETLADNRFRTEDLAFEIFTEEMGHSEEEYDYVNEETEDDYNEAYNQAVKRLFGNGHVKSVFLNLENPRILSRNSPDYDPYLQYGFNHYNEGHMAKRFNDGVIDEMFEERHEGLTGTQYVAFRPSQIKSADPVTYDNDGNVIPLSERFNPENADIRFRIANENQAIFVSNAAKAVEGIKMEKATPEQWLKMIEKNGGLKTGEDKWMGLSDWLKSSDKKTLTKEEVLDFVNENMIQIEEQHYSNEEMGKASVKILNERYQGWEDAFSFEWDVYMDEPSADISDYEAAVELYNKHHDDKVALDEDGEFEDMDTYEKVRQFGVELSEIYHGSKSEVRPIDGTREQYTTQGLQHLHEIALTVPTIESWGLGGSNTVHFEDAGDGRAVAWIRFGDASKWVPEQREDGKKGRTKKVLVIDEIQSKRHQEGREKGYRVANIDKWLKDNNVEVIETGEFFEFIKDGQTDRRFSKGLMQYDIKKAKRLYVNGFAKTDVPEAPFEKNWHELAMKRMLRYAAENGYDAIAWTKGEQQAERYNLGKIYNEIEREDNPNIEGRTFSFSGGNYDKVTVNEDGVVVDSTIEEAKGKSLSDLVGKDLAVKMMSLENYDTIDGEDLRIGGEGMKGFYDKILPAFMNKYGKKWGVKVEDIHLNLEGGLDMHSVPVTEEMKASVMEGQVMFRVRQENETPMEFEQSVLGDFKKGFNLPAPTTIVDVNDTDSLAAALGYTPEEFTDEMYNDILEGYEKGGVAFYERKTKRIAIFAREELRNSIMVNNIVFHENTHYLEDENPEILELGEWLWQNSEPELRRKIKEVILESGMYKGEEAYEMLAAYTGNIMSMGKADVAFEKTPSELQKHWELIFNAFGYEPRGKEIRRRGTGDNSGRVGSLRDRRDAESQVPAQQSSIQDLTAEERRIIGEYFPEFNKSEDVRMRVNSQGKELTEGQKEFFANSKAVDKDGNLLVLYHGTPRAGFTEFKSGWFTTSKEDAISYSGDRKGRLFDPNEKYEPETLTAGNFRLGYMTFDSEEDRAAFLERFPYAGEVMSEREYEDARMGAEDEEYDALTARRKEFAEVWNAYREYERERFVDTPIADLIANPEAYTEEDLMRAMLEYDSNASLDSLDDMSAEERKDALVSALQNANEETEGGILDMVIPTRVPRNGEGLKHNDLGNRTYEVYANVENPYEIDANGRGSEFESGDIYKAVEEALADEQYDGVIIRNWRVGRTQQLGDVVVPKNGSQIKLTSNENPTESSDIRFRTSLELDEEFGDAWRNQQNEDGRHSTQVANTKSTYEKIGHYLEDAGMKGASILDASSGLGLGTQALREMGFQVDDVEPFPSENREAPTFSSYADIDGKYDVVISNAVLNVIPDDWRADVLHQMADAVKEGGKMIINTRPASNIAQQGVEGKTRITLDSPSEILVKRGDRIAAYQKGFTSEELAEWIKSELGEGWRVEKATKKNSGISGEGTAVVIKEGDNVSFRTTGTPTDEVVANGLQLTPAQTAEVAANIFTALPEESRKKITDGLNGNLLGLQDAILQIPTSLATKENWNDEDRAMADVVAEEMTKIAGEMTRPFSAEEGLWLLYNNLNKGTDLISQASRALVQRNLGFDAETLAKQEQAKEDVRFRTVGDATSNAQASLYNRGAVNVWTRLKESYVDMMASVEELVKAIEKRTGKVAQGFENILLALNQQSSKGLAAMESYTQKFLNPMFDEIRRIMNETKMKYEDVVRYVILKHGLERNKKLAQRDARAHYQEIYDDIISKITGMTAAQKRTYLTNAQLKEGDAKAELATLKAVDMSAMTDEEKREHKKKLAAARKAVEEAEEHLKRAQKIASMSEQEAQDELDKIFEKIENGTDSVYKEMRENDYSGISSMFYDQLGVDRKKFSTEEQYQAALMEAKKDRYSSLADVEAAAESEVKSFEGKTDTKELWKRINAATKETLRQQYEANMISKDQYDNLRGMFEYYVPLRGFKDNTAEDMYTYYRKPNSTGYTKPILGAEGRKTEAESPFGWIAAMAGSAIASNVKNEAKLALYYFVSNRPENGIATISRTWFVDSGEVDERGKKIFKPAYPPFSEDLSSDAAKANYEAWQENMRELQKKGQAYEAGQRLNLGNAVVNISDANKPEHIVNVKVGGKDYTIIINGNPRAAQAINGDLNIEGTSQDYGALFGPVLRWMSSVNTSYNPEFWITNMMRDMAFTMMAVNIKEDPAYRRKFKKNYLKAFKVISLAAKNENGTIGDSYLEEQYKDFVKYGGVTGYTQIKDSETWEMEIENYLSSNDPESIKNGKVMRGMKSAFHAAHRFGESLEQVSRFAAFLTARETGKSINEAINDAKEITVNFNRKGSGKMITLEEAKYLTGKNGQPLTKPQQWMVVGLSSIAPLGRRFIMFFNAAIQGLNATYKLWKANPKRFRGWVMGYFAVGAMNAILHAMMDDDDDYLDIPDYERRNSLMIGGNGAYFKWALPQEARAFYALGDLAVETVMGRNPHQNVLGEALKIGTEILPVNPSEGWKAFMPSVAIPFIELALNEDYKGAPIYNEQKWLSEEEKERTAKWSNAYQGTGWTYVKIAQGLNFITGGDKYDAGWINLQPEKLEHLVQSAFGGTIRTADKFINTISAAIDPEEPNTIRQAPFLNRFLTINDERFKNVHVNDVFDYYKADAEHALTLEKKYTKDRDMDSLIELRSSDEYQWAKIYGRYKKPLKAIQDKIKVADGTAEKKELMKQQDELKKRMIKEISEL